MVVSSCTFGSYLVGFYTKYFPGNFFVNYAILAFGDSVTMIYVTVLTYFFKRVKNVIRFNLIVIILFSIVCISFSGNYPAIVPFGILILRVGLWSMPRYVYHMK